MHFKHFSVPIFAKMSFFEKMHPLTLNYKLPTSLFSAQPRGGIPVGIDVFRLSAEAESKPAWPALLTCDPVLHA